MKARTRWWIALGTCTIVVLPMMAFSLLYPRAPIDQESCDRALTCKSRDDIVATIGPPHFRPGELPPDLNFSPMMGLKPQEAYTWRGHDFALYFSFYDDGTVRTSYWKRVYPPPRQPQGVLATITRWFRRNS